MDPMIPPNWHVAYITLKGTTFALKCRLLNHLVCRNKTSHDRSFWLSPFDLLQHFTILYNLSHQFFYFLFLGKWYHVKYRWAQSRLCTLGTQCWSRISFHNLIPCGQGKIMRRRPLNNTHKSLSRQKKVATCALTTWAKSKALSFLEELPTGALTRRFPTRIKKQSMISRNFRYVGESCQLACFRAQWEVQLGALTC